MKPEAPFLRRFFFAGRKAVVFADDLPAAEPVKQKRPAAIRGYAAGSARPPVAAKKSDKNLRQSENLVYCI